MPSYTIVVHRNSHHKSKISSALDPLTSSPSSPLLLPLVTGAHAPASATASPHAIIGHALTSASLATDCPHYPPSSVAIVDSGTTDHLWHDYSAFTSYQPLHNNHVTLADNSTTPTMWISSLKVSLSGQDVGICDALDVPSLQMLLYSLYAHHCMPGCGFLGDNGTFHVYLLMLMITSTPSSNAPPLVNPSSSHMHTFHLGQPLMRALPQHPTIH